MRVLQPQHMLPDHTGHSAAWWGRDSDRYTSHGYMVVRDLSPINQEQPHITHQVVLHAERVEVIDVRHSLCASVLDGVYKHGHASYTL